MEVIYDIYLEDDIDSPMKRIELIFSNLTEEEKELLDKCNFKYEYTEGNKINLKERENVSKSFQAITLWRKNEKA